MTMRNDERVQNACVFLRCNTYSEFPAHNEIPSMRDDWPIIIMLRDIEHVSHSTIGMSIQPESPPDDAYVVILSLL